MKRRISEPLQIANLNDLVFRDTGQFVSVQGSAVVLLFLRQ